MKAAVYYGPGDIRCEQRPQPEPARDNLIVKVHCCAICGTDLKLATVGNPRCHPPRIIGHEMVGSVAHAGADVCGYAVGDRITLATTVACGTCPICARGCGNLCPHAKPISYDFDGAFAEYVLVPPLAIANGNVIKVPENVPDDAAALSEPLSCALNAQRLAGLAAGDRVLVVGGGPLGALHAELAKALGAARVMITELSERRLQLLRGIRDVRLIDAESEDVPAVVQSETDGMGADVVLVCAPARAAMEQALQYARKGGAVSYCASLPKGGSEVTLDSRTVHYGELRLVGASDSRPEHVAGVVQLMADGKLELGPMVTHRVTIDTIHDGLDYMRARVCLKVLVAPE